LRTPGLLYGGTVTPGAGFTKIDFDYGLDIVVRPLAKVLKTLNI